MIIIDDNNIVIDIANNIYVIGNKICVEKNNEKIYYMKDGLRIINLNPPTECAAQTHKYNGVQFTINEAFIIKEEPLEEEVII